MGTHSRIVIKRRQSNDIFLWQHWDGYLDGVGNSLCEQIKILLEKYSIQELLQMVENINEGQDVFETSMLEDVFTNKVNIQFNDCQDIQYEYIIDLENQKLLAKHGEYTVLKLNFEMIKNNINFSDIVDI